MQNLPKRPLAGEPLSLDLVNTQWMEGGAPKDLLASPGGLEAWLSEHELAPRTGSTAERAALEQVRDALRGCLASDDEDADARAALNEVLARGHVTPRLDADAPGESITVDPDWELAWRAARDYLALRQRWSRSRVRACAHPECILYFLDTTRNGTRRWCDMRTCGNRAKAQRYQQRHRG